ncbi:MAG: DsbE family thiol:disulfide interchange protein, partial [Proteobacteria bacterium]|nr:DsbE family thiol:disulfide interchange protein [Pseudomonadota bacterium]
TGPAVGGFLARYGDPYRAIGDDKISRVQLSLGSSGVPETFVIDGAGKIVKQHVGDIRADDVDGIYQAWRNAR